MQKKHEPEEFLMPSLNLREKFPNFEWQNYYLCYGTTIANYGLVVYKHGTIILTNMGDSSEISFDEAINFLKIHSNFKNFT